MVYRLEVDATGGINLPKEALEALHLSGAEFVRFSSEGRNLVIERSHIQPTPVRKSQGLDS